MSLQTLPRLRSPGAELLLLLVAIFWGTSYGLTQSALALTSVLMFIAIRFLLTHLLLLPVMVHEFSQGKNRDWRSALPTGLILLIIFSCEVLGVAHTSAANAAFLISLNVLMTPFMEMAVHRKPLDSQMLLLAVLSATGVYALTRKNGITWQLNAGDLLILAAAAMRALMVTMTKRLTAGKQLSMLSLTAIQSLIVGGGALIIAMFTAPLTLPVSQTFWLIVMYLVVFCTLFAFFAQNLAVQQTSATRVALLMGSEPLFGALFAVVWMHEHLTLMQAFGGLLILVSTAVSLLPKRTLT